MDAQISHCSVSPKWQCEHIISAQLLTTASCLQPHNQAAKVHYDRSPPADPPRQTASITNPDVEMHIMTIAGVVFRTTLPTTMTNPVTGAMPADTLAPALDPHHCHECPH